MGQRPAYIVPPSYLSKSPPLPEPAGPNATKAPAPPADDTAERLEPTRYGDWEKNGIAIDF